MTKKALAVVTFVVALTSVAALAKSGSVGRPCPARPAPALRTDPAPVIQVALLLDTSNSMDGLIDQARSQLWRIVNDFAKARRGGRPARLEVALYEYGNNRLSAASGWVRRVLPFTTDLDRVSQELFALTTLGGEEYCGTVIQTALDELSWSTSLGDLRVVVIAGNEPFTQGPVDFRRVCRRAAAKGITVNTIHCGSRQDGQATGWSEGALLADGSFSVIDQNRVVEHIDAPQDGAIARLGIELNKTYIPYGQYGSDGQMRQETQDKNASGAGVGTATSRAVTKANRLYSNSRWDLVDAVKQTEVDLGALRKEELPTEMQALGAEARRAFVLAKAKERERLQSEINRLNLAREQFVAELKRIKGKAQDDTLDVAMTRAIREQAACRGIELQ